MRNEKIKDVIAGTFSIILIFIVFYLYFADISYGTPLLNIFNNDKMIIYDQIEKENKSCHINSIEPTIILRMNDVQAYSVLTVPLVENIIKREIAVSLGVIPNNLEKDKLMVKYLLKIRKSPYIEIAQHGHYHNESDKNITKESLLGGYAKIQTVLGVLPVTYIPPYNEISPDSREMLSNYFKIISGKEGILKEGEKIAEIGQTTSTYYYLTSEVVPTGRIISKCKDSLEKINICVINIHPQEYATDINNPSVLSKNKFNEFKHLLDELQKLDVKFSTFKDLVNCD